jgi:hypothetical protein
MPQASESMVRSQAFAALERCLSECQQRACDEADPALQALIRLAETSEQRLAQPRCLSALTRVETHLNAVRWRLETTAALRTMMEAAAVDCQAPSTPVGQ